MSVGPTTEWFIQWIACLGQQAQLSIQSGLLSATAGPAEIKTAGDNAQRACSYVAKPYVPNFAWAALSDLLPAMFGIAILIIFGSKMELWQDLRARLFLSSKGQDGGYMMGQITKDAKDRHVPQQKQQQKLQPKIQGIKSSSDGFYDEDLGSHDTVHTNPYGSRVNLSLNTAPAVLGGPTLKPSVQHIANTSLGQRSPPHSPTGQQYKYNPTRGTPDPSNWPTWPSTYTTTAAPASSSHDRFPSSPTSPGHGRSFYSSEDIDTPTSPSRGTPIQGQYRDDVVGEASLVRLEYRQSTEGRARQFQATPRYTSGDDQGAAARVASPAPALPRKSPRRV